MPYEEHENVELNVPATAIIWRYMDIAKFLSMLEDASLYFCRTDQFDDRWEGAKPAPNIEGLERQLLSLGLRAETIKGMLASEVSGFEKRIIFANCWHQNDGESAAMWKLYAQTSDAVAVTSSVRRLQESLVASPDSIYVGSVNYIDYAIEGIQPGNFLPFLLHKKECFEHEREIRALLLRPPPRPDGPSYGVQVPVDLRKLITGVYVAPGSGGWFRDLVERVVQRYGFGEVAVIRSEIDSPPPGAQAGDDA